MAHSVRLPLPSGERAGVRGTTMERWQRLSPAEVDLSASAELLNVRNWTSCDVCQRRGGTSNRPFPLTPTLVWGFRCQVQSCHMLLFLSAPFAMAAETLHWACRRSGSGLC